MKIWVFYSNLLKKEIISDKRTNMIYNELLEKVKELSLKIDRTFRIYGWDDSLSVEENYRLMKMCDMSIYLHYNVTNMKFGRTGKGIHETLSFLHVNNIPVGALYHVNNGISGYHIRKYIKPTSTKNNSTDMKSDWADLSFGQRKDSEDFIDYFKNNIKFYGKKKTREFKSLFKLSTI